MLDAIHICLNARGRPDHFAAVLVSSHRFRGYADVSFELRFLDRVLLFGCVRIVLVVHLVRRSDVYTCVMVYVHRFMQETEEKAEVETNHCCVVEN